MSLVHTGKLSLNTLISKLTLVRQKLSAINSAARYTGNGSPADVTIFNPNLSWTVDTNQLASKGKNTPLSGATIKGKVVVTIYQGKIVYKNMES